MNIVEDFFDEIYVINLDKFPERLDGVREELSKIGIENFKRIPGVIYNEGNTIEDRRRGCSISHQNTIKDAKERKLNRILILEDNVEFSNDFLVNFESVKDFIEKEDWEMFLFGANPREVFGKVRDNIVKGKKMYAAHCYCLNINSYDLILNAIAENNNIPEVDVVYADIINPRGKSFHIYPRVAFQKAGYSYIEDVDRNNDYISRYLKDKKGKY